MIFFFLLLAKWSHWVFHNARKSLESSPKRVTQSFAPANMRRNMPTSVEVINLKIDVRHSNLKPETLTTVLLRTAVSGLCISLFWLKKRYYTWCDYTGWEVREAHVCPCCLNDVLSFQIHSRRGSTAGEEEDGAISSWCGSNQGSLVN